MYNVGTRVQITRIKGLLQCSPKDGTYIKVYELKSLFSPIFPSLCTIQSKVNIFSTMHCILSKMKPSMMQAKKVLFLRKSKAEFVITNLKTFHPSSFIFIKNKTL